MKIKHLCSTVMFMCFVSASCTIIVACTKRAELIDTRLLEGRLTLGTFNIAWLGDGVDDKEPRTEEEYKRIAEVIRATNPDILGVQEIENTQALERVLRYLSGYKGLVSTSGGLQNVGVIFKEHIQTEILGEYMPLAVESKKTRPGFVMRCKVGNFDWLMMIVHLKATSRADSTDELRDKSRELRSRQAAQICEWKNMVLSIYPHERDIIIVGDCNDYPTNERFPTLAAVVADSTLRFLTAELPSCKHPAWKVIDHILVNTSVFKRYIPNSVFTFNVYHQYPDNIAVKISDHCPVFCQFDTALPDNDE